METVVQQLAASGDRYTSPYNVARAFGAVSDARRALEWLEKAYQEHNPGLIELTREPRSDPCGQRKNSGNWRVASAGRYIPEHFTRALLLRADDGARESQFSAARVVCVCAYLEQDSRVASR